MFAILDLGGTHTVGTTYHPINMHTGAVQDHAAYLSNGQNVTKSAGKVVINQIILLATPTTQVFTYQIRSIDDATVILQGNMGGNGATPRMTITTPIEIDRPISIRFTAGLGPVLIDYDIAQI